MKTSEIFGTQQKGRLGKTIKKKKPKERVWVRVVWDSNPWPVYSLEWLSASKGGSSLKDQSSL